MTRTDRFVVGTLVFLLALIASLVGLPAVLPRRRPRGVRQPVTSRGHGRSRRARTARGWSVAPTSVSPLTARNQADRDLVALVFSGLVRNGPDGTIVPDLAKRWTVDSTGAVWTFELRPDARWQDGEPVTAEDVAFTIRTLQDPAYTGPAAGSWQDVTVRTDGALTVVFTLSTPLGGFLQAATQPIAPAHLLAGIPVDQLADDPFGRQPIGSGPFALVSLDRLRGGAAAGGGAGRGRRRRLEARRRWRRTRWSTPGPTVRPVGPTPYLPGIEFRFFDDARRAGRGLSPGRPRRGLRPAGGHGRRAGLDHGQPDPALPRLDPDRGPAQPATQRPRVRQPRRCGRRCSQAIDRPALIDSAFAMAAGAASGLIPSSSVLFDPGAAGSVAYDRTAAQKALKAAGWTKVANAWRRPTFKKPFTFELLSPDAASNPAAFAAAEAVDPRLEADRAAGHPRRAAAGRVRHRAPGQGDLHGRGRRCHDRARPGPVPAARLEPDADRRIERHRAAGSGPRQAARGGPQTRHGRRPGEGLLGPPGPAREGSLRPSAGLRRRVDRGPRHAQRTGSTPGRRPVGSILGCANMAPRR